MRFLSVSTYATDEIMDVWIFSFVVAPRDEPMTGRAEKRREDFVTVVRDRL
jgi:hypothetical protein